MRPPLRAALAVAGGIACTGAGFVAGAGTAALRGWGSPVVTIDVVNHAGRAATAVAIEYDTCGVKTRTAALALQPGQQASFEFLVCGEGGYRVDAVLGDGTRLTGADGYVESGQRDGTELRVGKVVSAR